MSEYSQCGASEPFALRVIGNDMSPEFCDGNIVIVDPGGLLKDGCFVVAQQVNDVCLRQLRVDDGRYYLRSPSSEVTETEITTDNIIGVVSQKAGRRRHQRKRYDL